MNISKTQLKKRLLDILNGAGIVWNDDGAYFEFHDDTMTCWGRAVQAIDRAFDLPADNRIHKPYSWDEFENIESLTRLVKLALDFYEVS